MGILAPLLIALSVPEQAYAWSSQRGRSSHKGSHGIRHSHTSVHRGYAILHSGKYRIGRGYRYKPKITLNHRLGTHNGRHHKYSRRHHGYDRHKYSYPYRLGPKRRHYGHRSYSTRGGRHRYLRYGYSRYYDRHSRHGHIRGHHYYVVPSHEEKREGYGKLSLAIQPPEARVFLNATYLGRADEVSGMLLLIQEGKHELLLSLDEQEETYSLDVETDTATRFEVDLLEGG